MITPTHHVTVEHHTETGTADDGQGGETAVREWTPVVDAVPARYTAAGEGRVETDAGTVIREAPTVTIHPRHAGEMVDGAYECAIGEGDDWRVLIHGLRGDDRHKTIDVVHERYGGRTPTAVTLELEVQV